MKKEFLDLGQQPIANKFLYFEETMDENEFFFDLKVVFDEETKASRFLQLPPKISEIHSIVLL